MSHPFLRLLLIAVIWFPLAQAGDSRPPVAAVASAHPLATRAGMEILSQGGNAFDAAVAVSAALAVVEPMGSGIGGGGFWLLHRQQDGWQVMIDGRERAPFKAHRDMYLDKAGNPIRGLSLNGPLAAGIPGVPAALDHMTSKYGRLTLAQNLAPAIRLAREGFPVYERYRKLAQFRLEPLSDSPAAAAVFLDQGFVPDLGFLLKQPDLARTLEAMAKRGRNGFYKGEVARKLVDGVRSAGGIWSHKDLRRYRVVEREPVQFTYHGARLTSAPLPSSGGIVMAQTLNILEGLPVAQSPSSKRKHLIVEAMRRGYRDRARYLGDSDFVKLDVDRLISKPYGSRLRQGITARATPSQSLAGVELRQQGTDTTHFSILDRDGNRVAATLSVNYPFGSAFMPPGTGVVLNNEMDDFSIKPGVGNVYGLVGNHANAIEPGKRPLSSMSPTFIETDDAVLVIGTPGGSRIISMVLLASLEFLEGRGTVSDWVALRRYHHQYLPDVIQHEDGAFTGPEKRELRKRGHRLKQMNRMYGNMQAVIWNKKTNKVSAASDPRGEGLATVQ
jgi:gamma-glutamyltranspeptidase/glutathione hydrolase